MRILVAGGGRLAVSVIEPLLDAGHEVVGLLQNGRRIPPERRAWFRFSRTFTPPALDPASLAYRRRIPVLWLDSMDDAELAPLRALAPDLILTAGFSILFNEALLALPALGCVNVHSSLLPAHRGPSPFAHVILAGEKETGVTFHTMTREIDAGAILAQESLPLNALDTSITVYYRCCDLARDMAADVIDEIAASGLAGRAQDTNRVSYDPRVTHDYVAIDWREPAERIERLVRAALAYTPAWFLHNGRRVIVYRATFDPRPVDAAPGTVLETRPYPVVATGAGPPRHPPRPRHTPHPLGLARALGAPARQPNTATNSPNIERGEAKGPHPNKEYYENFRLSDANQSHHSPTSHTSPATPPHGQPLKAAQASDTN